MCSAIVKRSRRDIHQQQRRLIPATTWESCVSSHGSRLLTVFQYHLFAPLVRGCLAFCFNMSLIDELSSMSVQFQPPSLPIFCRLGCEVWSAWTSGANGAVSKKRDWTTRQGILQNGMWSCPVSRINHKTPLGLSLGKNNKVLGVWPATSTASPNPQLQTSCQTNALDTDGGGLGWIRHKPGRAGGWGTELKLNNPQLLDSPWKKRKWIWRISQGRFSPTVHSCSFSIPLSPPKSSSSQATPGFPLSHPAHRAVSPASKNRSLAVRWRSARPPWPKPCRWRRSDDRSSKRGTCRPGLRGKGLGIQG